LKTPISDKKIESIKKKCSRKKKPRTIQLEW
jgi:hypothetical protein